MKKKVLIVCLALLGIVRAQADGGMWFMKLMQQQHLVDSLRRAGLKMKADQLYSESHASLRDCVGIFGNGCTGEIISPNGLVLTNNHCGYSYVNAMSTMKDNYLIDGYFAKSLGEEIPVPDLQFTFVREVIDVTDRVKELALRDTIDEYTMMSYNFLNRIQKEVEKEERAKRPETKTWVAEIYPFFAGNSFYLFFYEIYPDVRLVVNPPLNVAQFGGDGDNWIWPRHNPDFAVFRIYADSEGHPAEYSAANTPLHCSKSLPISLKGYTEGDYSMIMGFPGRTSRYLSASQLDLRMKTTYTPIVELGEPILRFNRELMDNNDTLKLSMASAHMQIQNVTKNYGGALKAVANEKVVERRRLQDEAITAYGKRIGNKDYAEVVGKLNHLAAVYSDSLYDQVLTGFGGSQSNFRSVVPFVDAYKSALAAGDTAKIEKLSAQLRDRYWTSDDGTDLQTEYRKMREVIFPVLEKNVRLDVNKERMTNYRKALDDIYDCSVFRDSALLSQVIEKADTTTLTSDPLYQYQKNANPQWFKGQQEYTKQSALLSKTYQRALHDMTGWTKAPDANFTQRLTYGHIKGYSPRDAVQYDYKTTLTGMFEKESDTDPDYKVNPRVRELYDAKDFGVYATKQGTLQTDFLSDNDITGGNSGSPVLNAKGELIGVAFDGNIESLSSDFEYNPRLQRCVNADIRYVLWTIDVFGGSKYLLKELDLRR